MKVVINKTKKKDEDFKVGDVVEFEEGLYVINKKRLLDTTGSLLYEAVVIHQGNNTTKAGYSTCFYSNDMNKVVSLTAHTAPL